MTEGREILRFMRRDTMGDVLDPASPKTELATAQRWPHWMRSDVALAGIGRLYRALHQAARGFEPTDPTWREFPMHQGEIVCHGDAGPWNVVYRDGMPVAFIDWDGAHPDTPITKLPPRPGPAFPSGQTRASSSAASLRPTTKPIACRSLPTRMECVSPRQTGDTHLAE